MLSSPFTTWQVSACQQGGDRVSNTGNPFRPLKTKRKKNRRTFLYSPLREAVNWGVFLLLFCLLVFTVSSSLHHPHSEFECFFRHIFGLLLFPSSSNGCRQSFSSHFDVATSNPCRNCPADHAWWTLLWLLALVRGGGELLTEEKHEQKKILSRHSREEDLFAEKLCPLPPVDGGAFYFYDELKGGG